MTLRIYILNGSVANQFILASPHLLYSTVSASTWNNKSYVIQFIKCCWCMENMENPSSQHHMLICCMQKSGCADHNKQSWL